MIALARKYRPRRFEDLLVQDHVATALRGAIARNRVGHGYLLTGPRGVGKTTAARILAMALNCENRNFEAPTGEPCGECANCGRIWAGSTSLDVVEIDAASNRGVDDARELRERAMYAPSQDGHHKVYIVDEAHMLTREAWNALLKILEEPPPGVVFVFATTEPQKIASLAAPVLSRLQRFDFRRIGPAAIRDRLRQVLNAEGVEADDDALTLIGRQADGGMRDALSVLDQCLSFGEGRLGADRVREVLGLVSEDVYLSVIDLVARRDPAGVFPLLDGLLDSGVDLVEFLGGLGEMLRHMILAGLGATPEDVTERMREALATAGEQVTAEDGVRMLKLLTETEAAVRRSANPQLAVETLLLRWTLMDRTVDLERLLAGGEPSAAPRSRPAPAAAAAPSAKAPRAPATSRPAPAREPVPDPRPESLADPARERPVVRVPFSEEGLRQAWPDVVEAARQESRFLGEALAACRVGSVAPPVVRIEIDPDQGVLMGAIERGQAAVEALLGARVGAPVRLTVQTGASEPEARPRRLSQAAMRAERLKDLRGVDPALDAAVDELDLEIVDESPPRE
jgi:DNA polymerase-3 subunit gamma/tau